MGHVDAGKTCVLRRGVGDDHLAAKEAGDITQRIQGGLSCHVPRCFLLDTPGRA